MSIGKAVRALIGAIVILTVFIQPATAQTSIGFENPGDTTNILAYRLPDWGYRLWDLGFDLNGSGGESYRGDFNSSYNNRFRTSLDSRFSLYRESEPRTYKVFADVGGQYVKSHAGTTTRETSGHDLNGSLILGGNWTQFLGEGPFSLRAAGNTRQTYAEDIEEYKSSIETDERRFFLRTNNYFASLDAGWGRVRDVTPLIRAQRLSERLVTLGREQLSSGQVQKIAEVLATEHGYRVVFDRPDKSFWQDVLEPMLDPDNPLSTYEVFYLRDVMEEDIGPRGEGFEVRAGVFYSDHEQSGTDQGIRTIDRGPALNLRWVKNLTFDHQLSLNAAARYADQNSGANAENGSAEVDLEHLWTIADRYRLDTGLGLEGRYHEISADSARRIERTLKTYLASVFTVFMENNLSLNVNIRGSNQQEYMDYVYQGYDERYGRRWSWSYGIGLKYYLDRVLY